MAISDWELFRNYESFELVKSAYKLRHGRTPNAQHAREIAASFTHARSYFSSARGADLTVRPLLLYYGVLSLSRGLTLSLSRLRESSLAQTHGLTTKKWYEELSRPNFDVSNLRVTTNGSGSLQDLASATDNPSLLRWNSSEANCPATEEPISTGAEYSFGELVERIPDLHDAYFRWKGVSSCSALFDFAGSDSLVTYQVRKSGTADRDFCDKLFENSTFSFESEGAEYFAYTGPRNPSELMGLIDGYVHFGVGELYVAARYPSAPSLSKISTLFLVSYMLGMLVRYHPTQWTALIRGQVGDAAMPTIAAAIDWIESEFPRQVGDFLKHQATAPSSP